MAIYKSGSVNVVIGSSGIKGNSTDFTTYVSNGDLFKLDDDNAFYEVASVVNATNFTLTSRYADTNYQTARSENIASANTATKIYSGALTNTPVIQNYVVITASLEQFTDNGAGVLIGNASPPGSGTIGYDDGAYSITLGTDLTATINVTASYYSGDTRNSMPYKVVTDFTNNYSFPELNLNDREFNTIFTKAVRLIDAKIKVVEDNSDFLSTTLADDAEVVIASNVTGFGFAQFGDNEEYGDFTFNSSNTVILGNVSASFYGTDTDAAGCVYDNGTGVTIKNRLGASKTVRYRINYS